MMHPIRTTQKRRQGVSALSILFGLCLCLMLGNTASLGQVITASVSGLVLDSSGAVVPQATVTLLDQSTKVARKFTSNSSGNFNFAGVNPGTYTVIVEAKGFKTYKKTDLALTAGDQINVPGIQLTVGSSSESIEVSAGDMPLVPTENGERSTVISQEDMGRLSTESRNASELMKILPGVTSVASGTTNGLGFDFSNSSSTGSAIGVGLSPNGSPYRGGTAYILDGANIIDPGCNCWSIAVINPDMAQEVKIQTSNFGADSANGPVIFSAVSKSGGAKYHGEAYFYARHSIFNANDWMNNYYATKRPDDHYYYPGGNVGGPIRIPHTNFNKNGKLLGWFGYEAFRQNLGGGTVLESTIPTAGMMSGDFTVNGSGNAAVCGSFSSASTNWCNDLSGGFAPDGTPITGGKIGAGYINAGAQALAKFWPKANADPSTHGGYNYYDLVAATHNGKVWRARADYSLNESNKFFVAFQQGTDVASTEAHMWWTPSEAVPYPGGTINNPTTSRVLTFNMLNILTPTLTNEFVFAWGYANSPDKPSNIKAAYASTIGYTFGTVFNKSLVAPSVNGTFGLPDTSMPDVWSAGGGSYPTMKATPSFSDSVSKVWKQHTFKAGGFTELVNNYQGNFANYNGTFSFASSIQPDGLNSAIKIGSNNPTANFLMGVASAFTQTNSEPLTNMAYRTTSGFLMDDWKVTRRFTANLGFRLDHIGRWYDRSGVGMAVWLPQLYASDVASNKAWPYPGVRWHGVDPGIPNSGSPSNIASTSPRLGMAWDILGTGKTVLRGGWGMYRWNDQYNDYGGPLTTAQEESTYNTPGSANYTFGDIATIGSNGASGALGGVSGLADPNDRLVPTTTAYNATVSQQLPWRTLIEVAYVGNNTANLLMGGQSNGSGLATGFVNQNKIPLGAIFKADPVTGKIAADPEKATLADYVPYAAYGTNTINMNTHVGYANYNALQIAWAKPSGRLTFNVNYTFQKALGIAANTVDAFTVHGNYTVLNIDRPQVFNSSYAYTIPRFYQGNSKLVQGVAEGWTISGTTTWQSGGNMQALTTQNLGMSIKDSATDENLTALTWFGTNNGEILPTKLCNPKGGLSSRQLMNASCFGVPTVGSQGLRQFPYLSGPSYYNTDLTIAKPYHITEKQVIEVKAAAFNAFNHPLSEFNGSQYATLNFQTADKANFTNLSANGATNGLSSGQKWGTMYYKAGRRIAELSIKYSF